MTAYTLTEQSQNRLAFDSQDRAKAEAWGWGI